jgi:hypothetical protein
MMDVLWVMMFSGTVGAAMGTAVVRGAYRGQRSLRHGGKRHHAKEQTRQ